MGTLDLKKRAIEISDAILSDNFVFQILSSIEKNNKKFIRYGFRRYGFLVYDGWLGFTDFYFAVFFKDVSEFNIPDNHYNVIEDMLDKGIKYIFYDFIENSLSNSLEEDALRHRNSTYGAIVGYYDHTNNKLVDDNYHVNLDLMLLINRIFGGFNIQFGEGGKCYKVYVIDDESIWGCLMPAVGHDKFDLDFSSELIFYANKVYLLDVNYVIEYDMKIFRDAEFNNYGVYLLSNKKFTYLRALPDKFTDLYNFLNECKLKMIRADELYIDFDDHKKLKNLKKYGFDFVVPYVSDDIIVYEKLGNYLFYAKEGKLINYLNDIFGLKRGKISKRR